MSLSSLHEQLRALRLGHFSQALQQQQEQPDTYTDMSFEERLGLLATHEILCRDNTKVKRLTRQAKLRFDARPSGIDYRSGRGLKKEKIAVLLSGQYLHYNQNIIITGATGCGKTHLA